MRLKYNKVWISYIPLEESRERASSSTTRPQNRSIYLCPCCRKEEICGFERTNNNSSLEFHQCRLLVPPGQTIVHFFTANVAYQAQAHTTVLTRMNSEAINLFIRFFCGSPVSFLLLSSLEFNLYSQGLIRLGQEHPNTPTNQLMPLLTRHKIPKILAASAAPLLTQLLTRLRGSRVSLLFDSGSINHHTYLAVCVCVVDSNAVPQFLQLSYSPSSKMDYCEFLLQVHQQLNRWRIKVASICTDGLSAQVEGIGKFQQLVSASTKIVGFTQELIPFRIPCFNHRINNVLKHAIENNENLKKCVDDLKAFSKAVRTKEYYNQLKKLCPTFVDTRWLCLSLMCSYVRVRVNSSGIRVSLAFSYTAAAALALPCPWSTTG